MSQHVAKTAPPLPQAGQMNGPAAYPPDIEQRPVTNGTTNPDVKYDQPERRDSIGGPPYENVTSTEEANLRREGRDRDGDGDPNAGVLDALPHPNPIPTTVAANILSTNGNGNAIETGKDNKSKPHRPGREERAQMKIQHAVRRAEAQNVYRRPSNAAQLTPEYRYCYKDGFVKPHRTHHCRACATVCFSYGFRCIAGVDLTSLLVRLGV